MLKGLVLSVALLASSSVYAANVLGCYSRDRVEKTLSSGEFAMLSRGTNPNSKVIEVWLNGKSEMMVISYTKSKNKDDKTISDVCVITAMEETYYNSGTIEALHKIFEKQFPTQ